MARRTLAVIAVAGLLLALAALPAAADYPPAGPPVEITNPDGTITVTTDDGRLTGAQIVIERDDDDDASGIVLPANVAADGRSLSFNASELDGATQVRISGTDAEGADYSEVYELTALLAGDGQAAAGADGATGASSSDGASGSGGSDAAAASAPIGDDSLTTRLTGSIGGLTPGLVGALVLGMFGLVGALLARDVGRRLGSRN